MPYADHSSTPMLLSPDALTVLETLQDAALLIDCHGVIVFANRQCPCVLGYEPAALVGRQVEDLLPEPRRAGHASFRERAMASGEPRPMGSGLSLVVRRADGTTMPVDIGLTRFGESGALMLACIRDMREHARLLQQARSAEDRYRMVVNSASEVFYRVRIERNTLQGKVEFVSPQCERVTGIPPERFLADAGLWLACVHPDDRPVLFKTTQDILNTGQEGSRSYRLRHAKTNEYRWVADRVVPLHDLEGSIVGYQGVARDVTEQRRAEQQRQELEQELLQAQKMEAIGRLAGGVAHDFNNLITVILASSDAARDRTVDRSIVDESLADIADAGRRAAELTRKLLTLSHEQPSAPHVLNLNHHLTASAALIRRMLPDTIELRWGLLDPLWPVHLDEGQLDQIVFNLAANARDAMPHGGPITIGTRNVRVAADMTPTGGLPSGDYVQLSVRDSGVGMDAVTIAHAFEPFYTTKGAGRGTGLGLASVYGIVKQNRGDIHLASAPGQGTEVVIRFPRTGAAGAVSARP